MSTSSARFLRPETPSTSGSPGQTPRQPLESSAPVSAAAERGRQQSHQSVLEKRAVLLSWIGTASERLPSTLVPLACSQGGAAVNVLLLAAKVVAFALTSSKAVLASLADSAGAT